MAAGATPEHCNRHPGKRLAVDSKAKSAIRTAETLGVLLIVALLLFSRCEPDTRLDVAPPAPSLVEKPASSTHDPSAHFRYVDADADATFRCALDGAHLSPCSSDGITYEHLRPGRHVFKVVAQLQQFLSEPTTWSWVVVAKGAPRPGYPAHATPPASPSTGPTQPGHGSATHTGRGSQGPIAGGSQPQNGQFTIKGVVTGLLSPGVQQPINLSFTNPFGFAIRITAVDVTVRPGTTKQGQPNPACVGVINLVVVQALAAQPVVAAPLDHLPRPARRAAVAVATAAHA